MPGLLQRSARAQFGNAPATSCSAFSGAAGSLPASNAVWSRQPDDVSFDRLQEFWGKLPIQARRDLLRVDKQTLCEQARKNLYCSRCHGLLLECFSQIVIYGKSMQQECPGGCFPHKTTAKVDCESENLQDPSMHPWGGLATTKDGILTLLDCFICARSLEMLQKVFDSSRQREHERELLYPDACGGGGRGWISQGLANYGRVYGARETCALHTSRLAYYTLVDFWSALGDETRSSLLRMKEDDFIERLVYRFDSKRFCRDCRRNVLREFKELKELKRTRKKLHCTSWFCVADTDFQYEVSEDSVQADWQHSFRDTINTFHRFEWAIGTTEGKADILDFEDVGLNRKAQVNGIDLSNLSTCFITLRAWKLDGRCSELCVKAHALKGQSCVHRRLIIGDGFVSITEGSGIKSFFEHAEDVEEEDDDIVDKDENELDGDGSRPQKHAKSPELAREFLLDAATVIFKEQVEKAFREGTARQNAHSLFISLAMKLLEERVHVACREIITLEKQVKLLEEEENEKREDEERRERRRNKEQERKLRRKERQKEKEKDREVKPVEPKSPSISFSASTDNLPANIIDKSSKIFHDPGYTACNSRDDHITVGPILADISDDNLANENADSMNLQSASLCYNHVDGESHFSENIGSLVIEQSKSSRRRLRVKRDEFQDESPKWYDKHKSALSTDISIQHDASYMKRRASFSYLTGGTHAFRERIVRINSRNCNMRSTDKLQSPQCIVHDRYDSQTHRCNELCEYKLNDCRRFPTTSYRRDVNRYSKSTYGCNRSENYFIPKGKLVTGASGREATHTRQVWEPMDTQRKHSRSNLGIDFSSRAKEIKFDENEEGCQRHENIDDSRKGANNLDSTASRNCQNRFLQSGKSLTRSKQIVDGCNSSSDPKNPVKNTCHSMMISSSSDSCSSCLSEGGSNFGSSGNLIPETSSTLDLEDISQQSSCNRDVLLEKKDDTTDVKIDTTGNSSSGCSPVTSDNTVYSSFRSHVYPLHENVLQAHSYLPIPIFTGEIMYYQNQNSVSWPFSQHDSHMLSTPIDCGLSANRFLELGIHYNTLLPPITTSMCHFPQHHLYHGKTRVFTARPNVQVTNSVSAGHVNEIVPEPNERSFESQKCALEHSSSGKNQMGKSSTKIHEGGQSFSLFHFGWPLIGSSEFGVNCEPTNEHAGPILNTVESQSGISCSIEETKMEEYSLFAEGNSSKFLFSSFTL
ncbi:hypothetical protein AXF42_Ash013278 [Apostasia shenzhenica]|uniref:Uncharacterized protein n=1 Tax=Apostasia shenzhenica TaxID=1088818 RepID=A0A2I0BBI6_9ASPA|nr:hypothetical protein AXF42_Ash013278 [Apostasia shenzhenica]